MWMLCGDKCIMHKTDRLQTVFAKFTGLDLEDQKQIMASEITKPALHPESSLLQNRDNYEHEPYSEVGERDAAVSLVSRRLEAELRAAKHSHLACGEVLLPCGLLGRVARDVLALAESEPCGLRGCTLYLSFESDTECRRLSTVRCDPSTVSTFELYLTLKQDHTTWHSLLPQFLKNLARGGTVMISSTYTLEKKKLYRSYHE